RALDEFTELNRLQPKHPGVLNSMVIIFLEEGNYTLALEFVNQLLHIEPQNPLFQAHKATAWLGLGKSAEAATLYKSILRLAPQLVDVYSNCAIALANLEKYQEALQTINTGIRLDPHNDSLIFNRGTIFERMQLWEDAYKSYQAVVDINPYHHEAWNNRGFILEHLLAFDKARESYRKSLQIAPDKYDTRLNLSLNLLRSGDFNQGWTLHEVRRMTYPERFPTYGLPLWQGERNLLGKTILLYHEQGLGDTIQFFRYVPWLAGLGAKVIVGLPSHLRGIFLHTAGVVAMISPGEVLDYSVDFQNTYMSMPLYHGTDLENMLPPARIHLDPGLREHWLKTFASTTAPKIGLVWRGSSGHKNNTSRSIGLANLVKVLPQNFTYVALQQKLEHQEIKVWKKNMPNTQLYHIPLDDFTQTAALASVLDLVISVDTSVLHLTASMGIPTWGLIPARPDWRWLLGREDSPWYPQLKLFRQTEPQNWQNVLDLLQNEWLQLTHRPQETDGKPF
ncbi:MAG: tetratricopeptide repeat-containing glycosyltransferase family protein, partial [Gammaproteobacteria bacterium]|nr:tetratricopeptide repeat-containing glycosyltransferase family protein [Gammaproteobacteria bacterium]